MVKIIKRIGRIFRGLPDRQFKFYYKMGEFTDTLEGEGLKVKKERIVTTQLYPGDLVFFTYDGEDRAVIIASNIFLSSSSNKLVGGFQLEGANAVVGLVVKALYKKRGLASYQNIKKSLKALIGPESYRTFNINIIKMQNLHSVHLNL